MKHFLQTWDKTDRELLEITEVAAKLKKLRNEGINLNFFRSGMAISWFRDQSTRTRYSLASAADLLGLTVQNFDEEKSQLSHGETNFETANMLSFLSEVIGIRDDKFLGEGNKFQQNIIKAVKWGYKNKVLPSCPTVINLQSDTDHPTQSLSDLMHMSNHFGGIENLKGKKAVMSWAYSPSYAKPLSVAQGFAGLATRFGMDITLAYPEGYNLIPALENKFMRQAEKSGGSLTIVHDMEKAFTGADIVYPKSWGSYDFMRKRTGLYRRGKSAELKILEQNYLEKSSKLKNWECTGKLMEKTKNGNALYMHCLPADVSSVSCKHGEVSKGVFEKYKKQTYLQAGYKPYVIAAMILVNKYRNIRKKLETI